MFLACWSSRTFPDEIHQVLSKGATTGSTEAAAKRDDFELFRLSQFGCAQRRRINAHASKTALRSTHQEVQRKSDAFIVYKDLVCSPPLQVPETAERTPREMRSRRRPAPPSAPSLHPEQACCRFSDPVAWCVQLTKALGAQHDLRVTTTRLAKGYATFVGVVYRPNVGHAIHSSRLATGLRLEVMCHCTERPHDNSICCRPDGHIEHFHMSLIFQHNSTQSITASPSDVNLPRTAHGTLDAWYTHAPLRVRPRFLGWRVHGTFGRTREY